MWCVNFLPKKYAHGSQFLASIMDITKFDLSNVSFGTPFTSKSGQKIIPLSTVSGRFDYDSRMRVQIGKDQDNMLFSEYGLNKPLQGADPNRRNMDIAVTPEMETAFNAFDALITKTCSEQSQELFKTPTLTKQFMPTIRTDPEKGAKMRVKVNCGDANQTEVRILRDDNSVVVRTFNDIVRNVQCIVVIDTMGIWSNATQFGVAWTARGILMRVPAPTNGLAMFNLKPGVKEQSSLEDHHSAPIDMDDD